jgi:hypothetical protein
MHNPVNTSNSTETQGITSNERFSIYVELTKKLEELNDELSVHYISLYNGSLTLGRH